MLNEDRDVRLLPWFALLFFITPLVEIYFMIKVGQLLGALPTISLVIFTAFLGVFLLRLQGLSTYSRLQATLGQGHPAALALMEGVLLLLGGVLLLVPGFVTDGMGLLCLLPWTRQVLVKTWLRTAIHPIGPSNISQYSSGSSESVRSAQGIHSVSPQPAANAPSATRDVLEGEYTRKDES